MEAHGEDMEGSFLPHDIQQLKELSVLYIQAKGLILYSEEVDPDSRSNLQVIKELRDSHDHIMRVIAFRLAKLAPEKELLSGDYGDYCEINIQKAFGHVYRAAFDALDGTIVSLRQKVSEILANYHLDVIKGVLPDYWETRVKLEKLTTTIAQHRARKDVGTDIGRSLDDYVADVESIKAFYTKLLQACPALDEYSVKKRQEEERERRNQRHDHILSGVTYSIISAVIGALIGGLLTYFGLNLKTYESKASPATPINQEVQKGDKSNAQGILPKK